jgi:hypothetical protein
MSSINWAKHFYSSTVLAIQCGANHYSVENGLLTHVVAYNHQAITVVKRNWTQI